MVDEDHGLFNRVVSRINGDARMAQIRDFDRVIAGLPLS
jgi:hypothetical protein